MVNNRINKLKAGLWSIRNQGKIWLKWFATQLATSCGYVFLTKDQTRRYLEPYLKVMYPADCVQIPDVYTVNDPTRLAFSQTAIKCAPSHIWQFNANHKRTKLLRCGLLLTEKKILNTDYWTEDTLLDSFKLKKRIQQKSNVLLAPWGHYFDGNFFVGYYDFMFLVAAKLCRMKDAIGDTEFSQAVVSYPLVGTDYEREFLGLMGFSSDRVVDSRQVCVLSEVCYLGNHDNWTHQNPSDILVLKKHLEPLIQKPRTAHNRVYISRAGRRRVLNEEALIALLVTYDFVIVDDQPRSLSEQYEIYHNASFILGPHGASFTNLLWCEPGTHLFELFAGAYAPTHFLYLCQVLDLQYSAYSKDGIGPVDYTAISQDITVSIVAVEKFLSTLFGSV